ncbi:MAG: FMN-binding negative transcriptional regulator [Sphingorhabdus sp.]|uniref:FMN-binding negative transcriptional regulator n=1 Tax=Sphingorhabdus sp. TaxID=1902408 RepID=UPI003C9ECBFE
MHPNSTFRLKGSDAEQRATMEALVQEIGFGMVFAQTPDGPRVAQSALFSTGDGAVQFHLSNGNALTKYLHGSDALVVINGPDAYISPDWYEGANQVPTWNYLSIELEGPVRKMDDDGLVALLDDLSAVNEARLAPKAPWTRDKMDSTLFDKMTRAITGFEMEIRGWRPTFKLSQNKPDVDRLRAAEELEKQGKRALAHLMREWVQ